MEQKLNHLVDKIYDTEFDFKSIKKTLKHQFYTLPIQDKEMKLLKEKFTKIYKNSSDTAASDPENPAECSYCYMKLQPGDVITNLPMCNHSCHYNCLAYWLKSEHTCPCCKVNIRKSLIEHYHGHFTYRMENFQNKKDQKKRLDNEISIDRAKNDQKLIDSVLLN